MKVALGAALAAILWLAACDGHRPAHPGGLVITVSAPAALPLSQTPPASTAAASGRAARSTPDRLVPAPTCGPSDLLVLVDKQHPLPADYVPPDLVQVQAPSASPGAPIAVQLRRDAAASLETMLTAARQQGIDLLAQSGYRSYAYQGQVYAQEVQAFGQTQADRESARAGFSEHQLGLAMDFTSAALRYDLSDAFANTAAGRWLAANGPSHGWVLSYPEGKEAVTGYVYEPWHYRYIGIAAATAFVRSGLTLNQWLAQQQAPCPTEG